MITAYALMRSILSKSYGSLKATVFRWIQGTPTTKERPEKAETPLYHETVKERALQIISTDVGWRSPPAQRAPPESSLGANVELEATELPFVPWYFRLRTYGRIVPYLSSFSSSLGWRILGYHLCILIPCVMRVQRYSLRVPSLPSSAAGALLVSAYASTVCLYLAAGYIQNAVMQIPSSFSRGEYTERIAQIFRFHTKRLHFKFSRYLEDLDPTAAEPSRKSKEYTSRHILFVVWESDDLGNCSKEAEDLQEVFRNTWGIPGVIFKIPIGKTQSAAQSALEEAVSKFLQNHDGDSNLLLIYYGGHGVISSQQDYRLSMKGYEIRWAPIRESILNHRSDVGMFIDACHAESAVYRLYWRHAVELIGCPERTLTPAVGSTSFSQRMHQLLLSYQGNELKLEDIHSRLEPLPPQHGQEATDSNYSRKGDPQHYNIRRSKMGPITLRREPPK